MGQNQEIDGCSLSAPAMADRREAWLAVDAVVLERGRIDGGFRLRYRHDPGVADVLRDLVEAEQHCCAWASWRLADEELVSVLEVTGPPDRISGLAAAFGL